MGIETRINQIAQETNTTPFKVSMQFIYSLARIESTYKGNTDEKEEYVLKCVRKYFTRINDKNNIMTRF